MGRTKSRLTREDVIHFRLQGLTYAEISGRAGITRQRVLQLSGPSSATRKLVIDAASRRCILCGELAHGHIHHQTDSISNESEYNDLTHLKYLCQKCHRSAHRGQKYNCKDRHATYSKFSICTVCGILVLGVSNKKYCSKECRKSHNLTEEIHSECVWCHSISSVRRYKGKYGKFCSHSCTRSYYHSQKLQGIDKPVKLLYTS